MGRLPVCPNCGYEAKSEDDPLITAHGGMGECPVCGIVIAKYRQKAGPADQIPKTTQAPRKKRPYTKIAGVVAVVALALVGYWFLPPWATLGPGDPTYGGSAESAGDPLSICTATPRGRYLRIHSYSGRRSWWARTSQQPRAFALSPTCRYLVTAESPRLVKVWEQGFLSYGHIREFQSSIVTPTAVAFTSDGLCVVVIGDDDEKLEVYDIAQAGLIAAESLTGRDLPAFRLKVTVELPRKICTIRLARAQFLYVKEKSPFGDVTWRLQDQVSGQFLSSSTSDRGTIFEPAHAVSWNLNGRYSAYSEKDGVLIWKLCSFQDCQFDRKE